MTTYLMRTFYDDADPLNRSDQIMVPSATWTIFDRDHEGSGPIFVSLGEGLVGGLVGRISPATGADGLAEDCCRLPSWMRSLCEHGTWIPLTPCKLPVAKHLIIRARREADALSMEDPAATLSAAICGSYGWACLSVGATLALDCGTFDVIDIRSVEDVSVQAACILDCDLTLEFVPALDHVYPESSDDEDNEEEEVRSMLPSVPVSSSGFIPFSGTGQRLGS